MQLFQLLLLWVLLPLLSGIPPDPWQKAPLGLDSPVEPIGPPATRHRNNLHRIHDWMVYG